MTVIIVLLAVYAGLGLLYWLWTAYVVLRALGGMPRLSSLRPQAPSSWPKLSVIVPACNEADKFEPAVRTLLAEDYPALEIVLVDDRSTDGTSEITDRIAAEDARVKAIHVTELPEDWLGKVHALNRGLAESSGELVLFTDADVHFEVGTLRKAVAYCLDEGLDFLTALPALWPTGALLDSVLAVFMRQLLVGTRPWNLRNPKSSAFLGIGAFNLVRRSAFEATEGFEWLRMETADDAGLGFMMKRSGAKCAAVAAFGNLALHWYRTLGEAARGAEKGYASVLRCSLIRAVVMTIVMLALECSPLLTLLPLLFARTRGVGLVGLAVFPVYAFSVVVLDRWAGARVWPALGSPLTALFLGWVFIRTAVLGRRRGGAVWRGTLYPSEKLLAGRRIPIP